MKPLHQPLGLRVTRLTDQHLRRQDATEGLAVPGQLRLPLPPPADRALTVPDQHPRHRTQGLDQLPPARIQILGSAAGDQHPRRPTGIPRHHRQHRQLLSRPVMTETHRHHDVREPEIALGDLAPLIHRAPRRVRRQIIRPQHRHPTRQRADRIPPVDPLRDHRRRHRRHRPQQLPNPRLIPIHHRPARPALIPRNTLTAQRRPHRVPRHAKHPRDLLDRNPTRPMQTPDLRPILHAQHPLPPRLD